MSTTYAKGLDAVTGTHLVVAVTDDPSYTVVATCDSEVRASQIAELLTDDES